MVEKKIDSILAVAVMMIVVVVVVVMIVIMAAMGGLTRVMLSSGLASKRHVDVL